MFVLAITGGIGSGKSVAAAHLAERGAVVLDLDLIARALVASPPLREVVAAAFPGVLDAQGSLDRPALARVAFADDESIARLDAIVHPAVIRELAEGLRSLELLERPPRVAVVAVPLLAEVPAVAELADHVLAIEAPVETRVGRCVQRGMAEDDCRARVARQAPDEARRGLADTVIANDDGLDAFLAALDDFWEREVAVDDA